MDRTADPARPGLGTTGPHVFVSGALAAGASVAVAGEEAHHLAGVLRVRPGQPVSLADGTGRVAQGVVAAARRDAVEVAVEAAWDVAPVRPAVRVVQALPKARKMDEVVQRLAEVGVDRITPVVTARTVKQVDGKADKVLARWRAVALAASRQARRVVPLEVEPVRPWPPEAAVGAVLWEQATRPLAAVVEDLAADPAAPPDELVLAIGPEGGFDEAELAEAPGLAPAALGRTILRTETAGLVAASLLLHRLGRLG